MKAYENCLANKHVTMTMQMESSPGESEHEAEPAAQPQTQTEHFEFAGSSMAMELKRSCCELGARVPAERAAAVEFKQGVRKSTTYVTIISFPLLCSHMGTLGGYRF